MIAALLSILGSSAVGSLIGGVFAFLNRRVDLEAKRMDHAQEIALRSADMELARLEADGRLQVAVVEGDAQVDAARMQAITAANAADTLGADQIKAAGRVGGLLLVVTDVLRRLVRPVLTVALVWAALWLNWVLIERMGAGWAALSAQQQYDAAMQAFAWVTGQASAVLSYWFVSRGGSGR